MCSSYAYYYNKYWREANCEKKGFFSLTVLEVHTLKSGSSITVVSDEDGGEQGSTWTKDHPVSQQAQKEQPS